MNLKMHVQKKLFKPYLSKGLIQIIFLWLEKGQKGEIKLIF